MHLSETFDCSSAVRGLFLYMLHAAVTAEPMSYGKPTLTECNTGIWLTSNSIFYASDIAEVVKAL